MPKKKDEDRGRAGQRLLKGARAAHTDKTSDGRPLIAERYEDVKARRKKKEKKDA